MQHRRLALFLIAALASGGACLAQPAIAPSPGWADRIPDKCQLRPQHAPLANRVPGDNPSDNLGESKGVIPAPTQVDPHIVKHVPPAGTTLVIAPPGAPGGRQDMQPK